MKYLMLDIGAGTMDMLYFDSGSGIQYKAVVMSPVLSLAEKVRRTSGDLLITGNEMGGGSISNILKERARYNEVIMSSSSAATINHDPDKVRSSGIKIIDDHEAEDLKENAKYTHLEINDLEIERIEQIINTMGVPFSFDVAGLCVQDHGVPPVGVSHLDYRHNLFKERLDIVPFAYEMLYSHDEIPVTMNRLISLGHTAKSLPVEEVYVMDSGMAAILGASLDPLAAGKDRVIVLDIATSHTVGAALEKGAINGFFEYHTRDITINRLESLLVELADGKLEHKKILEEGGHGAYIRKSFGFEAAEIIVATGPKRALIEKSVLNITMGSPMGDNMMTGTAGLLEAIRIRKGLKT